MLLAYFRHVSLHPTALVTYRSNHLETRDWTAHIIPLTRAINGLGNASRHARSTCVQNAAAKVGKPAMAFLGL
jgi:hypothetical protein